MATPDFIVALRRKIGNDPLWLCGVTAVVTRDDRVLLVRRADTLAWTPVTGIVDPGEEPADAAARETLEEAGIVAEPSRLALVGVTDEIVYDNGDRTQYVDLVFHLTWRSGDPHPADGENVAARWAGPGELDVLSPDMRRRVDAALHGGPAAQFGRTPDPS